MKGFVPGFKPFMDQFNGVCIKEHSEHFYNEGFPRSAAAGQVQHLRATGEYFDLNQKFKETKVPFRCVSESIKTNFPILDRDYFIVTPTEASMVTRDECDPAFSLEDGTHHVDAPVTDSNESVLFKTLSELISSTSD
jgi:hypothetical protein